MYQLFSMSEESDYPHLLETFEYKPSIDILTGYIDDNHAAWMIYTYGYAYYKGITYTLIRI